MTQLLKRALALCVLVPGLARAQSATIDLSIFGINNGGLIPQSLGDRAGLSVSSATRNGFGNAAASSVVCQGSGAAVWTVPAQYGDLTAAAYPCANGLVAEWSFTPDAGKSVTLESFRLGSYFATNGVSPVRAVDLRVYDATFSNVLFSFLGNMSAPLQLAPNISSTSTLYLQWGGGAESALVGMNLITTNIQNANPTPPGTTVPEPSTYVLMAAGLAGLGVVSRRRKVA